MRSLAIVLALLIAVAYPAFGATIENVKFVITDVSPKIVEPGYRGALNITVKNVGFGEGYRINAEIQTNSSAPVNFLGETKKYLEFYGQPCSDPVICNVLNAGDLAVFSYELSVDDNAAPGVYYTPLAIFWRYAGLEKSTTLNFGIEVVGAPELIISGTSTSPSVVYPDTEFNMPITVENIGTDEAKSVELALTLVDGLSGKNRVQLGTIAKDATSAATFNLKAGEGIDLGHHDLSAVLGYRDTKGEEYTKSISVDVFIQDRGEAKLSISRINTSPSKIYPNTDFTLTLTFENTGSQTAKATKLILLLPKEFTGEDSAFLGTIQKDSSSSASFDMKAFKSSSPGVYAVKAESTYTDEQGREKTSKETFDLFILDRGEVILEISGKSTSPTKLVPGTDFTLSLQLENIGEQDAKSVRIELEADGDLKGEFTSFVGEIEKDDVSTGVFDLSVAPTAQAGTRMVTARVIFIDERGVENSVLKSFDLFVGEPSKTSRTTIIIVAVVVLGLIIYLWRRRKSEYTEA